MRTEDVGELLQIRRIQMLRLREVQDLTAQMSQAASRRDETSVKMLLSMREEPVRQAAELEERLKGILGRMEGPDAARASEILHGGGEDVSGEEELLRLLSGRYRQLLEKIVEADRQLSLRIGDRRSFYRLFRDPDQAGRSIFARRP